MLFFALSLRFTKLLFLENHQITLDLKLLFAREIVRLTVSFLSWYKVAPPLGEGLKARNSTVLKISAKQLGVITRQKT